jgi:hypothetical protein
MFPKLTIQQYRGEERVIQQQPCCICACSEIGRRGKGISTTSAVPKLRSFVIEIRHLYSLEYASQVLGKKVNIERRISESSSQMGAPSRHEVESNNTKLVKVRLSNYIF